MLHGRSRRMLSSLLVLSATVAMAADQARPASTEKPTSSVAGFDLARLNRLDAIVTAPVGQRRRQRVNHAMGQRIQRLGPVQGQQAQGPSFFALYMRICRVHEAAPLRGMA